MKTLNWQITHFHFLKWRGPSGDCDSPNLQKTHSVIITTYFCLRNTRNTVTSKLLRSYISNKSMPDIHSSTSPPQHKRIQPHPSCLIELLKFGALLHVLLCPSVVPLQSQPPHRPAPPSLLALSSSQRQDALCSLTVEGGSYVNLEWKRVLNPKVKTTDRDLLLLRSWGFRIGEKTELNKNITRVFIRWFSWRQF